MIKDSIGIKDIDIIFSGVNGRPDKSLKQEYLRRLFCKLGIDSDIEKTEPKINEQIIENWEYEISKEVLREMFFESEKCLLNKEKKERIDSALREWNELGLGEVKWPFAAADIDNQVHRLNRRKDISEKEKDAWLSNAIIKFRRIKEISTLKNDYIEYLVIAYNDNVIPIFGNKRGTDFYIDGMPYDQKVSKSVGKDFIKQYGDDYRKIAIENPDLLAVSLYEHQDANRFGDNPRFLIVYLDTDMSSDEIENLMKGIDFSTPMNIDFGYKGNDGKIKKYQTSCYLILLHR